MGVFKYIEILMNPNSWLNNPTGVTCVINQTIHIPSINRDILIQLPKIISPHIFIKPICIICLKMPDNIIHAMGTSLSVIYNANRSVANSFSQCGIVSNHTFCNGIDELTELMKVVRNSRILFMLGERCVGKSSQLNHLTTAFMMTTSV